MRSIALLFLLSAAFPPLAVSRAAGPAPAQEVTVILADRDDAYYPLAEEIARREVLPIVHTLDPLVGQDPATLLWVVSPAHLSAQALVDYGLTLRDRQPAISVGIVSGATLQDARELWLRVANVRGRRVVAVNAANPSGHIEARIEPFGDSQAPEQLLAKANLLNNLQRQRWTPAAGDLRSATRHRETAENNRETITGPRT